MSADDVLRGKHWSADPSERELVTLRARLDDMETRIAAQERRWVYRKRQKLVRHWRDVAIVRLYTMKKLTLGEIGEAFGVSPQRIQQILKQDDLEVDDAYLETIEADLDRAKALLAEGRATLDTPVDESWLPTTDASARLHALQAGTIYGKDIYAAYKLLESFVEHIALQRKRFDCGSTDTCHIVPGCIRHLAEGNRALAADNKRLRAADPEPTTHCAECGREFAVKTTPLWCIECVVNREGRT